MINKNFNAVMLSGLITKSEVSYVANDSEMKTQSFINLNRASENATSISDSLYTSLFFSTEKMAESIESYQIPNEFSNYEVVKTEVMSNTLLDLGVTVTKTIIPTNDVDLSSVILAFHDAILAFENFETPVHLSAGVPVTFSFSIIVN